MLCPVCKSRHAPKRRDKWIVTEDPFSLKPKDKEAEKEYWDLYDNDIVVPCPSKWCSLG